MSAPVAALHLGLDLVRVQRITDSLSQFGPRFTHRVFTVEEIAYCESAPAERDRRYAARLAAKEATWKALGLDDRGQPWTSVEVCRAPSGACSIGLHEPLKSRAAEAGVRALSLSITHEEDYAAAVVLAAGPPSTSPHPGTR
jgi:holo-[acyl-carrier protein] synthase